MQENSVPTQFQTQYQHNLELNINQISNSISKQIQIKSRTVTTSKYKLFKQKIKAISMQY